MRRTVLNFMTIAIIRVDRTIARVSMWATRLTRPIKSPEKIAVASDPELQNPALLVIKLRLLLSKK
jgi:hypothetical protein